MSKPRTMQIEVSDLEKIYDALADADKFFEHRDRMNAVLHLAGTVRMCPLASAVQSARVRAGQYLTAIADGFAAPPPADHPDTRRGSVVDGGESDGD